MARWGLRLGAAAAGIALLVAAELALGALAPAPGSRMELFPLHGADGAEALSRAVDLEAFVDSAWGLFERDRALMWRLKPGINEEAQAPPINPTAPRWWIQTDARGRRIGGGDGPVVALGDSSTFGWGVMDDEAWPARLGAANLAVPGYSSEQGLAAARLAVGTLNVQSLVLAFGANDGHLTPWTDRSLMAGRMSTSGGIAWRVSGLELVARLRNALYASRIKAVGARSDLAPRVGAGAFVENLRGMAALAPDARIVLLDVCAREEYSEAMAQLAWREGYGLVTYTGETIDGCHPTAAGQEKIAREVDAALSGGREAPRSLEQ